MSATVLLIEDNPITAKVVRHTLETAGYRVVSADGADALEAFRSHKPSLVLLDLLLPDIDGFELFARLRSETNGGDVPILAFSGMLSAHDQQRLSEVGFDDVVTKPIEPTRLLQIVRGYLPVQDAATPASGPPRTVLVADDDAVQRKMVALRLQRAGFTVATAADGQQALERARELRPYAIVSDVLMPKLDGFGLCMAVRSDPLLAKIPVVLISNSYLDAEDRTLARRVGAEDMLVRTPELRDVIDLLRQDLAHAPRRPPARVTLDPELERERISRMMSQLERQIAMHAGLAQRCSLLSAELSVLRGISEAVATEHDIEGALHQILASCFDAGGISLGMMYLLDENELRGVRFGPVEAWSESDIATFFGFRPILDAAIRTQTVITIPSETHAEADYRALLERAGARTLAIAPLGFKGQPLGGLVTMARSPDNQPMERLEFVQAVAGQVSLALALARSFQAKDASEHAARSNAMVLRSVLESMAEGVVVTAPDGRITLHNQAANAMLPPNWELMPRAPDSPITRARRGERVERTVMSLPGTDRLVSVSARPLDEIEGGAVAVFRDITVERETQTRMLVNERMASLGTLAAGVGHEINNPLMSVLGNLEMALGDLDGGKLDVLELAEQLRDAKEAAERVRNIVRDLKMFSRTDEETRGEVDVQRVLESSIRMVGNEIRHRAELVRDFKPVPAVLANESRLGQVFLNLVVNAAQAIPEGRANQNEIRVATSIADDGRVRIDVGDTGSGMTAQVIGRIFTPFFTTKPIGVGTGLGLAICHQLVTSIGGEITVASVPGRGTTFSVLLPPCLAPSPAVARDAPVTQPPTRHGKVLVIDDDVMVAATIRRGLRGLDVTALSDPSEAIRRIVAGERFDVILCDLMMPNVTGMDVHAELAVHAPEMAERMVFITGGAFTEGAREFLEQRASVQKPVELEALRALIDSRLPEGR